MKAHIVRWGWQELNPCSPCQSLTGHRFRLSQLRKGRGSASLSAGVPNTLEIKWFKELYKDGDVNSIRIVGSVGERPLHVCELSVHRFGHVDFENMGNYVVKGIVKGILAFIEGNGALTGTGTPRGRT